MPTYINDGGTWRETTTDGISLYYDVGTGLKWQTIQNAYVNDSGTWREVFTATNRVTTRTLITSRTYVDAVITGRIYLVGAAGSSSRDGGTAGYGGVVIVDVNNAYLGWCTPGPGGGNGRADSRMNGGGHPTGGPGISGCATSVAWVDGTEFLIAGAGGGVGKGGRGGDAGEYVNYVGGCMGQLGGNGTGAGPNRGADYSTNTGGGNGGGGNGPDGGGGGGGYGGGGGSCHSCCGSSDAGGGGGGNRVLNYNSCIISTISNRSSRNDRNLQPAEFTNSSYGVPNNSQGAILLAPTGTF